MIIYLAVEDETPIHEGIQKILMPKFCPFYRQVKDDGNDRISILDQKRQHELEQPPNSHRFSRREEKFDLQQLDVPVFTRFVELLASLTLHNFSLTSKSIYVNCVDLRGIEYELLRVRYPNYEAPGFTVKIDSFSGMKWGDFLAEKFVNYTVCRGRLFIKLDQKLPTDPRAFSFVKKYSFLQMTFSELTFNNLLEAYCDALFHPGVEHVSVKMRWNSTKLAPKMFMKLLEYCENVKTLFIDFGDIDNIFINSPPLSAVKAAIQWWARKTTRLEAFFFYFESYLYQLHNGILKCLDKLNGKWYFYDDKSANGPPHMYRVSYNLMLRYKTYLSLIKNPQYALYQSLIGEFH